MGRDSARPGCHCNLEDERRSGYASTAGEAHHGGESSRRNRTARSSLPALGPRRHAPVRLGARAVGWIESEVDQWIRDQIAASREGSA
ncbi:MAG: AlpA family phage regulatory protein [Gemmatimonadota bacterium]|nr:AlpA family phage regulatory protein [Gemmatimonadota bacterium]